MGKETGKKWFIYFDTGARGPYSLDELLTLSSIDLETFAWRQGMENWKKIRDIPELAPYFTPSQQKRVEKVTFDLEKEGNERILSLSPDPRFVKFLIALFILLLCYLIYEYFP